MFKNGNEPITLRELAKQNEGLTKVMILSAIRKALVFHGSEGDINDESGLYLADEIINQYYYISMPELTYVINKNLTSKKYGKLSASELLDWVREYDAVDRVEYLNMHDSSEEAGEQCKVFNGRSITYDEYLSGIKRKASEGDEESIQYLKDLEEREKKMISKNAIYELYKQAKAKFFNERYGDK